MLRVCSSFGVSRLTHLLLRCLPLFQAKSNLQSCVNFRETAQVIAKVGFKMFLGITAEGQQSGAEDSRGERGRKFDAHRSRCISFLSSHPVAR
jgi:hypothetical protein